MKRFYLILLALSLCLVSCEKGETAVNGDNVQETSIQQPDNQGGENQGGENQGGENQGGENQGGENQGGDNQGGENQGGENQGGDNQGGENQGGENQGGENQGGENQGGENQGGENPGDQPQVSVQCETLAATGIGYFEATLNGKLTVVGQNITDAQCTFYVSVSQGSASALKTSGFPFAGVLSSDGSVSCPMDGFDCATTYYYVMGATLDGQEYLGDSQSFTTNDPGIVFRFDGAKDINSFSASLDVTASIGGKPALDEGETELYIIPFVYYGTSFNNQTGELIPVGELEFTTEGLVHTFAFPVLVPEQYYGYVPGFDIYRVNKSTGKYERVMRYYQPTQIRTFQTKALPDLSNAVDLGLSVKWSSCNLGANSPFGTGLYYAWGETDAKTDFRLTNYKWGVQKSDDPYISGLRYTRYCPSSGYGHDGYSDNLTHLLPEDDAATAAWGTDWRMPTRDEWQELVDTRANREHYRWEPISIENDPDEQAWAYKITWLDTGNSIVVRAPGHYGNSGDNNPGSYSSGIFSFTFWTADLASSSHAYYGLDDRVDHYYRIEGRAIRPVTDR